MPLDFTALVNREVKPIDYVTENNVTIDQLREASDRSIDTLLDIIKDMDDADVTFEPDDPDADDPHAVEGEQKIGWNIAHLIAHVTASSEEGAAISSLLARGVPSSERPRYETPWRDITTQAQCVRRLEESRRMRNAYLQTWPDAPHLDVYRDVSPRFTEKLGLMNAPAAFIFGLTHEYGHHEQFRKVAAQALEAKQQA